MRQCGTHCINYWVDYTYTTFVVNLLHVGLWSSHVVAHSSRVVGFSVVCGEMSTGGLWSRWESISVDFLKYNCLVTPVF